MNDSQYKRLLSGGKKHIKSKSTPNTFQHFVVVCKCLSEYISVCPLATRCEKTYWIKCESENKEVEVEQETEPERQKQQNE